MNAITLSAAAFTAAALAGAAAAQTSTPPLPKLPTYAATPTEWAAAAPTGGAGGSGSAGVQVVNLLGDPSKPGVYVQLLKAAPNTRIAAHRHAGERVGTVLAGTWMFGFGEAFDEAGLKVLPAGSVYSEPSGAPHFAMTGAEPVVVQITGVGPTDTVYQDPARDPARAGGAGKP